MNGHAGTDDDNVARAEGEEGLAEGVVLAGGFGVKEGDLNEGDVERVGLWIKGYKNC